MICPKAIIVVGTSLFFARNALAYHYDNYGVLHTRDYDDDYDYEDLFVRDWDDYEDLLFKRWPPGGSFKTGDLTPGEQIKHAEALNTLMKEDFQRTRQSRLDDSGTNGKIKAWWRDAQPPMLDTIHKPGTDGRLHYGISGGKPNDHDPATKKLIHNSAVEAEVKKGTDKAEAKKMTYAQAAACHQSGSKCAEHSALNSFNRNNPLGSTKGANSYAAGSRVGDRTSTDGQGNTVKDRTRFNGPDGINRNYASPDKGQDACSGVGHKIGCKDHLKTGGISDLNHERGTKPGDDAKKNKNKPGGKNKFKNDDRTIVGPQKGGTLGSSSSQKQSSTETPTQNQSPGKIPHKDDNHFPALPTKQGSGSGKPPSTASQQSKSYAAALNTPASHAPAAQPKSGMLALGSKASSSSTSTSTKKHGTRSLLRRRLDIAEW